ncbi:hypothetical protein N3K66_000887 [Trichothecium roseum]|uniref:Uncharacterized protein n=1 Tax=Trichothecium roseum TaxID=47278 RepID=A0ACC0VFW1_9HYPO|nr:hypothetical protein N3K66_000887 [Trichothecium roseum]
MGKTPIVCKTTLIYIARGEIVRRGILHHVDDATTFKRIYEIINANRNNPESDSAALEEGFGVKFSYVDDVVNPFGDDRGDAYNSRFEFNLAQDMLFWVTEKSHCWLPLDFIRTQPPRPNNFTEFRATKRREKVFFPPSDLWEPDMSLLSERHKVFLGRILSDFLYSWRHLFRRSGNHVTFMRLTYALIWIASLDFTIRDRTEPEICGQRRYVRVIDLPEWETPLSVHAQKGACWFILAPELTIGIDMVQAHVNKKPEPGEVDVRLRTYIVISYRQVCLCRVRPNDVSLTWTKPRMFLINDNVSVNAINLLLWALYREDGQTVETESNNQQAMEQANISPVSAAKMRCEAGIGSPFTWRDRNSEVVLEKVHKPRDQNTPIESQILFAGALSGLSYTSKWMLGNPNTSRRRNTKHGRTAKVNASGANRRTAC